ncbi:Cytochrome c domain-containing protein [Cupriavidus sp. H18C1]|uniref:c-type cytochrome n=1 Tax=Cupriavidus sp. H18C1 TaxID=3241601 RepID=UPI003BB85A48
MLKERIRRIAPRGAVAFAFGLALAASAQAAPDIKALADKNGCFSCHGMQGKLVGPGFAEVAARYKGGQRGHRQACPQDPGGRQGGYGGRIPMPPHPSLKDEEARQLAAWVLEAG